MRDDSIPESPAAAESGAESDLHERKFERLRHHLLRAVGRACPPSLASHKEDIVQTVLLRLVEAGKTGEQNVTPATSYLWKMAYTATVDEIRRMRRRREDPLDPEEGIAVTVADDTNPLREASAGETGRAIRDCLSELEERRRLVVGLFLLGHGPSSAARRLGWRFDQVRNLLYRGLGELRHCLRAKGITP